MSESDSKSPKWIITSRDSVERIRSNLGVVRKAGQEEIRRGQDKVNVTNEIEREVDYVGRIVFADLSDEVWNDEIVTVSGTHLAGTLEILDSRTSFLAANASSAAKDQEEQHGNFMRLVPSTDSSSGTALYVGASVESRIHVIMPEYHPRYLETPPERIASRDQQYEELLKLLTKYDPKFANMLEGSEAALNVSSPDHLSQAAHSMRDLFQQLIEELAPSKVVEAQPWFETTTGAPGGISRRSRLRYLLYGSGELVDEGVIEQLDVAADAAKQSLDLCIARAHDHDPSLSSDEVRLAIDQGRFSLAKVIAMHRELRGT